MRAIEARIETSMTIITKMRVRCQLVVAVEHGQLNRKGPTRKLKSLTD